MKTSQFGGEPANSDRNTDTGDEQRGGARSCRATIVIGQPQWVWPQTIDAASRHAKLKTTAPSVGAGRAATLRRRATASRQKEAQVERVLGCQWSRSHR